MPNACCTDLTLICGTGTAILSKLVFVQDVTFRFYNTIGIVLCAGVAMAMIAERLIT